MDANAVTDTALLNLTVVTPVSGLRQFLATESPLKMMENTFYYTLKTVLFSVLSTRLSQYNCLLPCLFIHYSVIPSTGQVSTPVFFVSCLNKL